MNKIEENKSYSLGETEMEESTFFLLKLDDFSPVFNYADKVNTLHHGLFVDIRAILEFSNICKRKCKYCGLNSQNKNVHRYRMNREEIISTALEAIKAGYRTLVMQSGEDDFFTAEYLGEIVKEIKSLSNVAITLSCGERTYEELKHFEKMRCRPLSTQTRDGRYLFVFLPSLLRNIGKSSTMPKKHL